VSKERLIRVEAHQRVLQHSPEEKGEIEESRKVVKEG